MYRILYTEFLKIKKAKMLLVIPIISLTPALLLYITYLSNTELRMAGWPNYLGHILLSVSEFSPPVFILFTGFIFSREYSDHTMDCMITYPISRVGILVSKMLVMVPVVLLTMFLSFASALVVGNFLIYDSLSFEVIVEYAKIYLLVAIIHLTLVPAAATVGIISKNIIASAVTALAIFSFLAVFLSSEYNAFFPWCVPALLSSKWGKCLVQWNFNVSYALISLTITFVIALVINVIYFRKTELIAK
ncbi:MAG: ABC transporter permease [Clostridia bacterium]|nr:ABC transporter permease [Clostridia bacterium]